MMDTKIKEEMGLLNPLIYETKTLGEILQKYLIIACFAPRISYMGICVDEFKHAVVIYDEIRELYSTIPNWLSPRLKHYSKGRFIQFDNGSRIILMNNPCHGRGTALNIISIWDGISNMREAELMFLPCIVGQNGAYWRFS